jgi:hypothetical protein
MNRKRNGALLHAICHGVLLAFHFLLFTTFIISATNGGHVTILTNHHGEQAIELIILTILTPLVTYYTVKDIYELTGRQP